MDFNKFLELLENREALKEQKGEAVLNKKVEGEVPADVAKKFGFKWAYVPKDYSIMIGLIKDSNDITTDKWQIIAFEPKSEAASKAKSAAAAEFGESQEIRLVEALDKNFVVVAKSPEMNYETLLQNIKDLLENKTIKALHMSADKLKLKK